MSKVKQYLFSIPPGKEGSFCNMLTSYKSLAYLVSSVNEEECRAFVEFSRPTSIPQKKLKDIKVLEVLSTKQENIDLCMLNIYSKLQKTKEDLKQLLEDVEKRIEELHTSE